MMYVICYKFEVYVIVVLQVKFDIIVEVWWGNFIVFWQYYMIWIVSQGYKIIFFFCWYFNYISYGQDWRKYYQCEF